MKNEALEKIIEKLKAQINTCAEFEEPLNECSWGNQTGVLITANEAKLLIKACVGKPDSDTTGGLGLHGVSNNEAVIFCENEFSTCIHQSFDKCTLKEKCPSQKMKAK